jgi:hypothetical protein
LILVVVALLAALSLIGATASAGASAVLVQPSAMLAPDAPQPPVISYQGRLVDPGTGEPKPDGTYNLTFSLYDVASGGTALWTESQNVAVAKGLFSATLGNTNTIDPAIFDGYARWLGVLVKPDVVELSPRIRVASAPYAIWSNLALDAYDADRLGGSLPSSYRDATNLTAGTLNIARYSAVADLMDEGMLGNASGDIAMNNGTVQTNLNADLLDGQQSTAFAAAAHSHDSAYVNATGDSMSGSQFSPVLSVANTSTGAGAYGIYGSTASAQNGVAGVRGSAGVPGTTIVGKYGVLGQSDTGKGVVGVSTDTFGTYGWSTNSWGVRGEGSDGGVFGLSWVVGSTAVRGENSATTGASYGVYGENNSTNGGAAVRGDSTYVGLWGDSSGRWSVYGRSNYAGTEASYAVYGTSSATTNARAIYGIVNSGTGNYAGYFAGPVYVSGMLTKAGGGFKIDHPLDPENKYLYHSFVESPEMMNVYNGNVVLDEEGKAWVEMPAWFEALNQDFRYQLTAIGGPGPNLYIAQKIQDNRFQIAGGAPGLEVSWQVTGIRHDPYADAHRIPVEEVKPVDQQGTYMHPDAYGQPETLGADYQSGNAPEAAPVEPPGNDATASNNSLAPAQPERP